MTYKLTWKIVSVFVLAGVMLFTPLLAEASDVKKSDQTFEANVMDAIRGHKNVKAEVKGADVILKGHVATRNEKTILEERIRQVPGITYVRDEVKIGQSTLDIIEETVEDAAITAKIKAKILATKGLEVFDIHVKTEQNVVVLSGTVESAAEKELAEKVAREVKEVKAVVNRLSVAAK